MHVAVRGLGRLDHHLRHFQNRRVPARDIASDVAGKTRNFSTNARKAHRMMQRLWVFLPREHPSDLEHRIHRLRVLFGHICG